MITLEVEAERERMVREMSNKKDNKQIRLLILKRKKL